MRLKIINWIAKVSVGVHGLKRPFSSRPLAATDGQGRENGTRLIQQSRHNDAEYDVLTSRKRKCLCADGWEKGHSFSPSEQKASLYHPYLGLAWTRMKLRTEPNDPCCLFYWSFFFVWSTFNGNFSSLRRGSSGEGRRYAFWTEHAPPLMLIKRSWNAWPSTFAYMQSVILQYMC